MALRATLRPRAEATARDGRVKDARARELTAADEPDVAALLSRDPVQNVYLRSELRGGLALGEWWGVQRGAGLSSVVAGGLLLVPWIPDADDARLLAPAFSERPVRMLVGPRDAVLALHRALGRQAREVRNPQLLLGVGSDTLTTAPQAALRRATRADLDELVVAAADMHREEMGVDPLLLDADGWRSRMRQLIDRGWSWIWRLRGRIVFKAELSAWTPEAVQIQGVYTDPAVRGRGVATQALASMCRALLRETALCTLYVNHYNTTALALYRRVGFQTVAPFATVIY
jgi:ribosomal protein S18 acetylase RimI-like enzyme